MTYFIFYIKNSNKKHFNQQRPLVAFSFIK
jgi:hypothetical protein